MSIEASANTSQGLESPPFPAEVCLAKPADITRAAVAWYASQRPANSRYNRTQEQDVDWIKTNVARLEHDMKHPQCIVLVAEDDFQADEHARTAIVPTIGEFQSTLKTPPANQKVVVGIAIYNMVWENPYVQTKTFAVPNWKK